MATTTITRAEFDRFWDEVLGEDWFVEETDLDADDPDGDVWAGSPDDVLRFDRLVLGWQGYHDPSPNAWITRADLRREYGPSFTTLLSRWRKQQTMKTVTIEVPADKHADLVAFAASLGSTILTS